MMLEYKGGKGEGRGGVKNVGKSDYVISECSLTMLFVNFCQTNFYFFCLTLLILCDISAEFYLNYKFIIKIIMYSSCAITSFKYL